MDLSIDFYNTNSQELLKNISSDQLVTALKNMLLIRSVETRAEAAYQQGLIGGFFHTYIGQEAIQTAAVDALGVNNWWLTTYRCHALALLLGVTPHEMMAEFLGKATGNARGRGGSMHLYSDNLLGGFAIVGGHMPIAAGAAFTLKYKNIKDQLAVCFLGDGAVAQGAFHESLNLAALWDLPCLFVIENNQWGMGTAVDRAISVERLAKEKASGYGIEGYTVDGMDYLHCLEAFSELGKRVMDTQRPILVEAVTERFRGHSISDPGLYRSKDDLKQCQQRDPIVLLKNLIMQMDIMTESQIIELEKELRKQALDALNKAKEDPDPVVEDLEEDVFAPISK